MVGVPFLAAMRASMSAWSKLAWSPIFCRRSQRITAGPTARQTAKLSTVAAAAWNVSSVNTRKNPSPCRPSQPDCISRWTIT